ncbi:MAG: cytochrome oxidase biogenesis protein CtaA [Verrucomicrobia bacterium]|nr:cytochrome oxidase biogenesis protein CtaA [Verrucomicrobiota bacterium]
MNRTENNPWLSRFALFTALNTLLLISVGGLVTSKGAGMAVPDWPTTFGENMFTFHPSKWTGGIFYEHTHRLLGSWVGLLTLVLAFWTHFFESRAWLRRLAWLALFMVCLQGLLGGLRVTLLKNEIGIFHAALAQSFLVLLCVIGIAVSPWWHRLRPSWKAEGMARLFVIGAVAVLLQLFLGAAMRHQHSGLAVPDFPLAYGKLWPDTDPQSLMVINLKHADHTITALHIHLHMLHRVGAALVVGISIWVVRRVLIRCGPRAVLGRGAILWQVLIAAQALLGAITVWTGKHPWVATAHVVLGAACLALVSCLAVVSSRKIRLARHSDQNSKSNSSRNASSRVTSATSVPGPQH